MQRLLIVDDQPLLATALARTLEDTFAVTSVGPSEAFSCLEREPYDAIVSDLMMPSLTGVQFYRWVRSRQADLAERIVFMTGLDRWQASTLLGGLPNPLVLKPFRREELLAAVARVLAMQR